MRVLHARHGAAAEHHLVIRERAGFVGEDVLHLPEVLGDVERTTLKVGVALLIVQLGVLVDEVNLADLHDFDGHEQRDGDQHLRGKQAHFTG